MLSRTALAAIGGAIAVSGCGITGPAHMRPPPPGVDAVVTMGMSNFMPPHIRIRPGGTVQWRNTSLSTHTVTADPRLARNPANILLPPGAPAFHSGRIGPGQVWARTFTVPGTYRYVCLPHERMGMMGTVVVG